MSRAVTFPRSVGTIQHVADFVFQLLYIANAFHAVKPFRNFQTVKNKPVAYIYARILLRNSKTLVKQLRIYCVALTHRHGSRKHATVIIGVKHLIPSGIRSRFFQYIIAGVLGCYRGAIPFAVTRNLVNFYSARVYKSFYVTIQRFGLLGIILFAIYNQNSEPE